ncbi:hypothetical protein PBY51_000210 [Eleginops maclovinus]|uniref:Transglutaminase-like domain-containing protein n=1 Tax=Eleginops maclovinus TaxID=56733 RepID=A0AAN7XMB7_ELEMC|nr:hypothetical protein PBY51_000210 [Eleginops maclovinus]
MDFMQQTTQTINGINNSHCRLKLVNYEAEENSISHETHGLSEKHLVVRRGKPFKLTMWFHKRLWDPQTEYPVFEVFLGNQSERIIVQYSGEQHCPQGWSAKISPCDIHSKSVTIHICSPVTSPVAQYYLFFHIETIQGRRCTFEVGTFVLLCNPWLKEDPVYMPLDAQTEEYVKSDYGILFTGTHLNIAQRPWMFGQYEPGVLEACMKLLQVSQWHFKNKEKDYSRRADPVYLSRVICAMVNCNDDLGILAGNWSGNYKDGVNPTEWSSSADILKQWALSNCRPVLYGQCWVFASVLCTVMRVLGVPSRVVTVFNAAHDCDSNLKIVEYFSSTGEKLPGPKDSIWNFHVWVECWMRRPDLGSAFDGWQVVDPTPQEKSGGIFCCGPCPVVAIQHHVLRAPFDAPFIYAAVDADLVRVVVCNEQVVKRTVDTETVGHLIYTKSIGSDLPENLTPAYKSKKKPKEADSRRYSGRTMCLSYQSSAVEYEEEEMPPDLEVSLSLKGVPTLGESIVMCVTVRNNSRSSRVLREHVNAQQKEYNGNAQQSFWKSHKEERIKGGGVLELEHSIPLSEYESVLAEDDIVNVAVVIKDVVTDEIFLATQEFNITSPKITVEIEGGDRIQIKKEYKAHVSFINTLSRSVNGAVLTVEGSGLLQGKQEVRMTFLKQDEKIENTVTITATGPGTKLLKATFSHSNSPKAISKTFHKVIIVSA